ncbi:MAG: lysophospholipid acyltransferase family protein [Bacillota bacterium]
MKERIIYLLYRALSSLVNLVPRRFADQIGRRFGDLAYLLLPDRRDLALQNLQLVLGVSQLQAKELTKANFRHLGQLLVEFMRLPQLTAEKLNETVEIEGLEHLTAAAQSDQGYVLCTAHLGNWELLGAILALKGFKVNALAREQSNQLIYEDILRIRENKGINVFANKGMAMRKAYQVLEAGEGLFVLNDQKSRHAEHYIELFGLQARTRLGAVELAARTNSLLLPIYIVRHKPGQHRIIVKPPCSVPSNPTISQQQEVMSNLYSNLEAVIRDYPEQWLWAHNRWQDSPDLE